jgi:type II secretory pathway component GspD/PulD (secretin)
MKTFGQLTIRLVVLSAFAAAITVASSLWGAETTKPGKKVSGHTKVVSSESFPFTLQFKGNHLTIKAETVPLRALLEGISKVTGIEFSFVKPLAGEVTINLSDTPLEETLQRLLGVNNYALFYIEEHGGRRIDKVLVLSDGQTDYTFNPPASDPSARHAQAPAGAKGAGRQSPMPQKEMIEALVQWGDEQAVDFFVNSDPEVYQIAITALQIAMNSEDPRVKANAQSLIQKLQARLESGAR